MGKGPGTIYKDCVALATQNKLDAELTKDKISKTINRNKGFCCLLEQDVKKLFMAEDYGLNAAEKYIKQWIDLDMASRMIIENYIVIAFPQGARL